jgi:prepilin-type N-terminal cleavage/methylation domain-containing protein
MTTASPRSRSGFTLVEILACLLLFSMGLLAVIGVFMYGLRSASAAQADATAWSTALSVLKDPMPLGAVSDPVTGQLVPWTWSSSGSTWTANDGSGRPAWEYTAWPIDTPASIVVPDMADPQSNSAAFPAGGPPAAGCARGWLNGYYVERREQSLATDRLSDKLRLVEVRVDVYLASYGPTDGRPLASAVDRVVRNGGL